MLNSFIELVKKRKTLLNFNYEKIICTHFCNCITPLPVFRTTFTSESTK